MKGGRELQRKLVSHFMFSLCGLAAFLAVATFLFILGYTLFRGALAFNLELLINTPKPIGEPGGGLANAIVGTVILIGLASLLGIPVGVLAGIFLAEFANRFWGMAVRFTAEVLTGVPSIIMGIFVYSLVVTRMGHFSALAGGIALGAIMIPIIAIATHEVMRLVPRAMREAGLALGIPLWRTLLSIVIPSALSGIVTGIMIAIARVAGETAPLLFTAFGNPLLGLNILEPMAALPLQIFAYGISPYREWQAQAWAASALLLLLVLFLSLMARFLARRIGKG